MRFFKNFLKGVVAGIGGIVPGLSGSVLMVIGPAGLSSVEYPRRIPGAIVVDNLGLLDSVLNGIVSAPEKLPEQAASIRKFAEEHHQIPRVRERLHQDFSSLL